MREDDVDIDATLAEVERVVRRARLGALRFSADDPPDPHATELRALLAEAQADARSARPRWAAARRGLGALLDELREDLSHLATVKSGPQERPELHTWVGWGGDTVTILAKDLPGATCAAHTLELQATTLRRLRRLRLFAVVLAAAPQVAALFSTPVGALFALPAAWRLIQSIREGLASATEPGRG